MRRVGSTPQERGSAGNHSCPDIFQLASGDFLVVGDVISPSLASRLVADEGGSIGASELAVVVSRSCMLDAAGELAARPWRWRALTAGLIFATCFLVGLAITL